MIVKIKKDLMFDASWQTPRGENVGGKVFKRGDILIGVHHSYANLIKSNPEYFEEVPYVLNNN